MSLKKFTRSEGGGIKSMRLIFKKTKKLIYLSKANLDVKIVFGNITQLIDPEIWKILARGLYGNQDSTFHSGP